VTSAVELARLETISGTSSYGAGPNQAMVAYSYTVFTRHMVPGSVLEMGPAEGHMTDLLAKSGRPLYVVEGSSMFCEQLQERYPHAIVTHALFEEYEPVTHFNNILLGHVLEHVVDPVSVLKQCKAWLAPGGRILAAVPNARSIHRQAAVLMRLLSNEHALNDADVKHGHRRVYNPESFRYDFLQAGLEILFFGGYWLKPVSNSQIERDWTPEMLDAFMKLGERYPDIAGENYIVAGRDD